MKILGSQVGVILFLIIGCIVVWVIDKVRKEKTSNEEAGDILGFFMWAGIIFAFVCFFLYECTHPED